MRRIHQFATALSVVIATSAFAPADLLAEGSHQMTGEVPGVESLALRPVRTGSKKLPALRGEKDRTNWFAQKRVAAKAPVSDKARVIKGSLYSSNAWPNSRTQWGIYSIPATGGDPILLTSEEMFTALDYVANGGGTPFGHNYYYMTSYASREVGGDVEVTAVMNTVFDATTWLPINNRLQMDEYQRPLLGTIATAMSADPVTGKIYGTFFGDDDELYSFGIYNTDGFKLQVVSLIEEPWEACGFDTDGTLYAITYDGSFYKVNKQNGDLTLIKKTGLVSKYMTSGAVNPDDHMFYFNLVNDGGSEMWKIDLTTGDASKAFNFNHGEELLGMYFSEPAALTLSPAAPKNLTALFAGTLSAKVSFTLPTETVGGDKLDDTELTWTLNVGYSRHSTGKGMPGTTVEVPVTVKNEGIVHIDVYCNNDMGSGPSASTDTYAGETKALPSSATDLTVMEDTDHWGRTTVSWTPPTTDINGKAIGPDGVVYWLSNRNLYSICKEFTGTSVVVDMGDLSQKQFFDKYLLLTGGEINGSVQYNWDSFIDSPLYSFGKPYSLPFKDRIGSEGFDYNWIMVSSPTQGHWTFWDGISTSWITIEPYGRDNGLVAFEPAKNNAIGEIRGGRIDLGNAASPTLLFHVYCRPDWNDIVSAVIFEADAQQSTDVHIFHNHAETEGWVEFSVPLDDYKGRVIQISLMAAMQRQNSSIIAIDEIEVRNCLDNDLGVYDFSTPSVLTPGRPAGFGVMVRNWGRKDIGDWSATLYCNNKPLATQKFDELEASATRTVVFDIVPTPLFDASCEFHVEVDFDGDSDISNNVTESVTMTLNLPDYPAPLSLKGEENADGTLLLTWLEPEMTAAGELSLEGFNIYRDGEKINGETITEMDFTDTKAAGAKHTYHVTAVYTEGESAPSEPFDFVSSSISDIAAAGVAVKTGDGFITVSGTNEPVTVYDLAGRTISAEPHADTHHITVGAGIYLVKIGRHIVKVTVK